MAIIFNSQEKFDSLKGEIIAQVKSFRTPLCLASVAIGQNYGTNVYRLMQEKIANDLGIRYLPVDLEESISQDTFKSKIGELNNDKKITGIILNKPLLSDWNEEEVFSLLSEDKDVEGLSPQNLGKLFSQNIAANSDWNNLLLPPTAKSVLYALNQATDNNFYGKRVVIVGFSSLLGKPLSLMLANAFATVSITHIASFEGNYLREYLEAADIIISAVGKPNLIKSEWTKEGAILIDVGIGERQGKQSGDIEFDKAKNKASFITPVPGGIGKLTPLFLYQNLIIAAKRQ